jgi:pimeloyl-ACP methyl ester carboxylesterase
MSTPSRLSSLACLLFAVVAGCGDDGATPEPIKPAPPEFPAPEVAGTPETDALANAAASCGQPAFAWNKDLALGDITAWQRTAAYPKAVLEAAVTDALGSDKVPLTLQYDVETHLVTYVTQDRGQKVEATTLLAWPTNVPADAAALPVLVILHGTSGFTDGCGPSKDSSQAALAAAFASAGFVTLVPDYIGLKSTPPPTGFLHPYLVGQATAIASLDAVRTLGHLPADLRKGDAKLSARVAIVGGSQGGHAALWVDRLAPYYARELDIVGIAATVPPADLVGESIGALTKMRESTANVVAFYAASSGWYGAADKLSEVLVAPLDKDVPAAMAQGCDPGGALGNPASLDAIFQKPILDAAASGKLAEISPWGCMGVENGLTTTSVARIQKDAPSYGILFVTGGADTLVDTPTERVAFEKLCNAGMPMTYLECAGAGHTKATTWALPEILGFLNDRLAGKPFTKACTAGEAVTCQGTPTP